MVAYVKDARKLAYDGAITTTNLEACVRGQEIELAFIVDITSADGVIAWHYSNRHINVGGVFYEGRLKTPSLNRKMTELFSPDMQFSEVVFDIWAGDDALNEYLPTGASYSPLIGAECTIKIGFPSTPASFTTIFSGSVHFEGAMTRNREYISLRARDKVAQKLLSTPNILKIGDGSYISQSTVAELGFDVPWIGKKVTKTLSNNIELLTSNSDAFLGLRAPVLTTNGYNGFAAVDVTPNVISSGGTLKTVTYKEVVTNIAYSLTSNYASTVIYAKNILNVVPTNAGIYEIYFDDYLFEPTTTGTAVYNFCVSIAGLSSTEIVAVADMASLFYAKMDVICEDSKKTNLSYIASWAKQSCLDMFISLDGKLTFTSFLTSSMPTIASMRRITNQSIVEDSISIEVERTSLLTASNATYGYSYTKKSTINSTKLLKNANAETKYGKRVAKTIDLPNIGVQETVSNIDTHLSKFIRLMSAGLEFVTLELTFDFIKLELGEWVKLNITAQAADFSDTPAQVRELSYNLDTGSVTAKLLSYANFPCEQYTPANAARCISSYNASIVAAVV
jgi:hypothetical protein